MSPLSGDIKERIVSLMRLGNVTNISYLSYSFALLCRRPPPTGGNSELFMWIAFERPEMATLVASGNLSHNRTWKEALVQHHNEVFSVVNSFSRCELCDDRDHVKRRPRLNNSPLAWFIAVKRMLKKHHPGMDLEQVDWKGLMSYPCRSDRIKMSRLVLVPIDQRERERRFQKYSLK